MILNTFVKEIFDSESKKYELKIILITIYKIIEAQYG